jgi:hypothetical protein
MSDEFHPVVRGRSMSSRLPGAELFGSPRIRMPTIDADELPNMSLSSSSSSTGCSATPPVAGELLERAQSAPERRPRALTNASDEPPALERRSSNIRQLIKIATGGGGSAGVSPVASPRRVSADPAAPARPRPRSPSPRRGTYTMIIYSPDPVVGSSTPDQVLLVCNEEKKKVDGKQVKVLNEQVRLALEKATLASVAIDAYAYDAVRKACMAEAVFLVDADTGFAKRNSVVLNADTLHGMRKGELADRAVPPSQVKFTETPITFVYRFRKPM